MQANRLFVGACAAAVLGAIMGARMNTTPLERGFDASASVPHPDTDAAAYDPAYPENLPDHYPIVTPQGRFEVGELRTRGLYRNRRFARAARWDDPDWWGDQAEPSYAVAPADLRYIPRENPPAPRVQSESVPEAVAREEPMVLAAAESEPLAPPPVEPPPSLAGSARTIDLAADLAGRR